MKRWLEIIESDYFQTYVADGGSAVKFVITRDASVRGALSQSLRTSADRNNFQSFSLDGSATKLHFIQFLFHELARQLDWDKIATSYMQLCFQKLGLQAKPLTFPVELTRLAEMNGGGHRLLADRLQSTLRADLAEDYAMSHEFRMAILHLCLGQVKRVDGGLASALAPAVVRWLRGETQYLSELKDARIFQKVARNNARHLLVSLTHMLRKIGRSGTFINIDISRYLASNRFADRVSGHYYTPAAVVDLYELLRQLVDEQGAMEGVLIVILATPELLSDSYRSLNRYQALKMRIVDDVRVRSKQNLLSPMVRF
jgi:hypothetical protein